MGEYLHEQGFTCLGIRLPGHATNMDDMIASRRTDWTAAVEEGFHELSKSVDRIYIAGLSMGGVLSLLMSTKLDMAGVIAISTPYELPRDPHNYPIWFIKAYSWFVKYAPKSGDEPGAGWFDKQAYRDHVSYDRNPVRSVAELKSLLAEMRAALPLVTKPVLLIHSQEDTYVLPQNVEKIYDGLVNARDKTKLYVKESGHVVTKDAARQQVFGLAYDFIRRINSTKMEEEI